MSERDESTGQFTPSTEGLYGHEAELAEAGFRPMPETIVPPEQEEEYATPREAAEAMRATPEEPEDVIVYHDTTTGERLNSDPSEGPIEAITVERAAEDLTKWHSQSIDRGEKSISRD